MRDLLDWNERLDSQITWRGRKLTEKETIRDFLVQDRDYAAFALADLDPPLFEQCRWYGAETAGQMRSLALVFEGLTPPALFLMGDATGLALLFGSLLRDQQVYATCKGEHLPILEAYYSLGRVEKMTRMVLNPDRFQADRRHEPERLMPASILELRMLYDTDPAHIAWFQPQQVGLGFFYGMRHMGRLVSAAGTHLASLDKGIAAVGNVLTHADHRGQGFASACVSSVTESLLQHGLTIVLNVSRGNASAMHIYDRIGYEDRGEFLEVPAVRRRLR